MSFRDLPLLQATQVFYFLVRWEPQNIAVVIVVVVVVVVYFNLSRLLYLAFQLI